ncbi:hypothetical protein PCC8801_1256 [Rippkaea orientalis PCC 8801]|uniref:Uncharacterized protein n=1 Tax=Rippkaea orientalis (strain PCC 8801 / RF-1) TaxID=41431 RepID=B7K3H9_RIPO1|nr:hypothetical protein [Rippkaea orientalis]ACK65321.1 hypothetical protein PCC8801_1256 [Rippkaea orientalis PCC 8801]
MKRIEIPLTKGEEQLEKDLTEKPEVKLLVSSDFEEDIPWELANLTRIAYKNYALFNENKGKSKDILDKGHTLYTNSTISRQRIDKYLIVEDSETLPSQQSLTETFGGSYHQYSILATYNFLAYTVAIPPKPYECHLLQCSREN